MVVCGYTAARELEVSLRARVNDGGKCYASGTTDSTGKATLTEIPEGDYVIRAKVLGVSTLTTCSLTRSKTEETPRARNWGQVSIATASMRDS